MSCFAQNVALSLQRNRRLVYRPHPLSRRALCPGRLRHFDPALRLRGKVLDQREWKRPPDTQDTQQYRGPTVRNASTAWGRTEFAGVLGGGAGKGSRHQSRRSRPARAAGPDRGPVDGRAPIRWCPKQLSLPLTVSGAHITERVVEGPFGFLFRYIFTLLVNPMKMLSQPPTSLSASASSPLISPADQNGSTAAAARAFPPMGAATGALRAPEEGGGAAGGPLFGGYQGPLAHRPRQMATLLLGFGTRKMFWVFQGRLI